MLAAVASNKPKDLCLLCTTLARNLIFPRGFAPPRRAALKPHSARHGPGSKTVEQGANGGNRGSPLSLLPPVLCIIGILQNPSNGFGQVYTPKILRFAYVLGATPRDENWFPTAALT